MTPKDEAFFNLQVKRFALHEVAVHFNPRKSMCALGQHQSHRGELEDAALEYAAAYCAWRNTPSATRQKAGQ